jgi:crossover junction endodeoxyribonuclease RuvC
MVELTIPSNSKWRKSFAQNRNASLLNVFVDEIKAIARRKGLKILSYAPNTVKKEISGNGRASKKEVAKLVAAIYPELKVYLSQDRAGSNWPIVPLSWKSLS